VAGSSGLSGLLRCAGCGIRSCSGEPVVRNGLALCKLHHAASDRHIWGFGLDEIDGPMLRHGLQGFNGERIHAPHAAELRPAEDFLAERFELFRKAAMRDWRDTPLGLDPSWEGYRIDEREAHGHGQTNRT
jgi:hypothetical protein